MLGMERARLLLSTELTLRPYKRFRGMLRYAVAKLEEM